MEHAITIYERGNQSVVCAHGYKDENLERDNIVRQLTILVPEHIFRIITSSYHPSTEGILKKIIFDFDKNILMFDESKYTPYITLG